MDVCRGETTGRVDSIYNDALPVTNPAQRSEEVIITPLMAVLLLCCNERPDNPSSSEQC